MPPSCISLYQLPLPDSLIAAQLASPAQVTRHICITTWAIPVTQSRYSSPMWSSGLLIIHVVLHFPLFICFSFQWKQTWLLWNNSKNMTGISHHSLPSRTLTTPPAETTVPSLKYPFWVCHSDSVKPYWVWTRSCLPRQSISPSFTLFEVNATRQENNETCRAFHHKHRLWGHFLHRVEPISK